MGQTLGPVRRDRERQTDNVLNHMELGKGNCRQHIHDWFIAQKDLSITIEFAQGIWEAEGRIIAQLEGEKWNRNGPWEKMTLNFWLQGLQEWMGRTEAQGRGGQEVILSKRSKQQPNHFPATWTIISSFMLREHNWWGSRRWAWECKWGQTTGPIKSTYLVNGRWFLPL